MRLAVWSLWLVCLAAACAASPKASLGGNAGSGGTSGGGGNAGSGGVGGTAGINGNGGVSGGNALSAEIQQPPSTMSIELITISCDDDCKNVLAVARGGNPDYSYAWSDGVSTAAREVCVDDAASLSVTVTDTAFDGPDFHYDAHTATATLRVEALDCPTDGGMPEPLAEVSVPGTSDVWLAGAPDGTMLMSATDPTPDVAPTNSPIEVAVVAGSTLTFAATGATSYSGAFCAGPTADGGCLLTDVSVNGVPPVGLSNIRVAANALLGVFLSDDAPTAPAPAMLNAMGPNDFTMLSPLLQQVFFIGDGLTGTGSGSIQRFVVPSGATRLFLGSADSIGGNYNNAGSLDVSISIVR